MITEIVGIKNLVEKILSEYPITRNNDQELLLRIWEKQGLFLSEEQKEILLHCSPLESITRARRSIQRKGLYLATEKVRMRRLKREIEARNYFSSKKPEYQPYTNDQGVTTYKEI